MRHIILPVLLAATLLRHENSLPALAPVRRIADKQLQNAQQTTALGAGR